MKTMTLLQTVTLGASVIISGCPAHAATTPSAIHRAESGFFVGVGGDFQHYGETFNNSPVDSENGTLLAYTVGLMGISRHTDGLYWSVSYTGALGTTHYQGNTHIGLPAQALTTNTIRSAQGRLGLVVNRLWRHDRTTVLIPYIGMGFHRFARNPDQGLLPGGRKTYSDGHVGIGLRADYALTPHWVIALHALTGYTLGAQVSATDPISMNTATGTMQNADITEALGDRPYTALGAEIVYLTCHHWQVAFHVRRTQWAYGGSGPILIPTQTGTVSGYYTEPQSHTTQTLVMIDVSTAF
ncbi:MAG: hypothetical protein ACYDEV_05070 [Acidiferrobacter sp.]